MSAFAAAAPRGELGRLARFCAVGATNTALTIVAFTVLVAAGVPAARASAAAFALGALNGYQLNVRWTFAGAHRDGSVVARYVATQLAGTAISALGEASGRGAGLSRLGAELVILPLVTLCTYALGRRFVFRDLPA